MLKIQCTTEEKVHIRLAPVTLSGKPATVDGTPVWEVVSGNGTVVPDDDGLGAFLLSTDDVDGIPTVYTVKADADLGDGVIDITDTVELTTTNAGAANLGMVAETPVPKS